eukprot:5206878-Amphidinium_carterae.1
MEVSSAFSMQATAQHGDPALAVWQPWHPNWPNCLNRMLCLSKLHKPTTRACEDALVRCKAEEGRRAFAS